MTFDAMNILFQFGIFLATAAGAVVATFSLYTNKKK